MEVWFKTKELRKCAEMPGYALRRLGAEQAKVFLRRLQFLLAAESFEDLRNTPGHFHELTHNRKGQWGYDLNGPWQLIVTPKSKPIPVDENGRYIWRAIRDAVIVEIVNYHKEGDA